jgi:hypothetical protein
LYFPFDSELKMNSYFYLSFFSVIGIVLSSSEMVSRRRGGRGEKHPSDDCKDLDFLLSIPNLETFGSVGE